MVFCNTKRQVDELTSDLQARGYSAEALHGDMRQEYRDWVMNQFRKGNIEILVATDVAARGLDVENIEAVFNYDLPNDEEYYVHRIGRTGRAGREGKSFTFVVGREIKKLQEIQRYIKTTIIPLKPPTLIDYEESKLGGILNLIKDSIASGGHIGYIHYIEKMLEELNLDSEDNSFASTLDISAALLKQFLNQAVSARGTNEVHQKSEEKSGARKSPRGKDVRPIRSRRGRRY